MDKINKTAATLMEKPIFVHIGFFWFKIKPLTLSQIWEIGSIIENVDELDMNAKANVITELMRQKNLVHDVLKIIPVIIFRGRLKRLIFSHYIKRHLTMKHYKKIIEFAFMTFQAGFFLTSISFLRGIRETTTTTNTQEATLPGDSSEE